MGSDHEPRFARASGSNIDESQTRNSETQGHPSIYIYIYTHTYIQSRRGELMGADVRNGSWRWRLDVLRTYLSCIVVRLPP